MNACPSSPRLANACTFLFVPANRPDRLKKALESGADAVIVDLEDAVAPINKLTARLQFASAFETLDDADRAKLLVRINAQATSWYNDDLELVSLIAGQGLGGVVVPKAESATHLAQISAACSAAIKNDFFALVPLIESAHGLGVLEELANALGVLRLALGHLDLQADMGMRCAADEAELQSVRFALVAASRRAGLSPPIDGVTLAIGSNHQLQFDTSRSRRFGFGAKLCIHPAQLATVQAAFCPTSDEIEWAHRVIAAQAQAAGEAFSLEGQMVDLPVVLLAQQTLARSERTQPK